jgi:hypothetical protein
MNMLKQYDIGSHDLFKYDDPGSSFPVLYAAIQEAKKGNNAALKAELEKQTRAKPQRTKKDRFTAELAQSRQDRRRHDPYWPRQDNRIQQHRFGQRSTPQEIVQEPPRLRASARCKLLIRHGKIDLFDPPTKSLLDL